MAGFRVQGSEQLGRVARALRDKGNSKALQRRLSKTMRSEATPITRDQKANLAARLPKRGGLAAEVTGESQFSVRTNLRAKTATVTIVDTWPGHDMPAIDKGLVRHPLYGNRKHWYTTDVPSLLLTEPFLGHRRSVQFAILRDLEALAEEIAREV